MEKTVDIKFEETELAFLLHTLEQSVANCPVCDETDREFESCQNCEVAVVFIAKFKKQLEKVAV